MGPLVSKISESDTESPILLDDGKPFDLNEGTDSSRATAFRQALNSEFSLQK